MENVALSPTEVFSWLADLPDRRNVFLECGAGRGEVSQFMVRRFSRAISSDIDGRHLPAAVGSLETLIAAAEEIPLPDACVDLLASVQAFHHFDKERHLAEAKRLLAPGGVLALLCWGEIQLPADIAAAYRTTFQALEPHWENARPWVLSGYRGVKFVGEEIRLPEVRMKCRMTLEQLNVTIARWSATQAALAKNVAIPEPLATARGWPDGVPVSWPLLGRVFKL